MVAFINDDPFVLSYAIPALHALGFTENDVLRHVPHDGVLASLMLWFSRLATTHSPYGRGSGILALPPWLLMAFLRRAVTRRIAALKNKASRNIHYEAEKIRRRKLAAERRRVTKRTTTNPCPAKETILEAWKHVRDSKESLVMFGSLMQDLECYVDNSLRFDRAGHIVGRNAGVKGWLRANLPELAAHYTSVMRYKAAAKKLRQIVGLSDPTPVTTVLGDTSDTQRKTRGKMCNYGAEKLNEGERTCGFDSTCGKMNGSMEASVSPPVEVVRARAVYLEVMNGIPDIAARILDRIDALCDPERTDEAATLRGWREKYAAAITVRIKDNWWRKLTA